MTAGAVTVGDSAPDFELIDRDGRPLRLSALAGRTVVLLFHAGRRAPVLDAGGTTVVAIAPALGRRRAPYPELADRRGTVFERYGVRPRRGQHTAFVIGPDGRVRRALRNVDARADAAMLDEAVAAAVQASSSASSSPAEVTGRRQTNPSQT